MRYNIDNVKESVAQSATSNAQKRRFPAVLAGLLFALMFFELGRLVTANIASAQALNSAFSAAARAGFLVLCIVGLPACSLREKILLGASITLAAFAMLKPEPLHILAEAIDLAAFFGVFIAMLTVMKEAATRSRAVADVGIYLTSQPPGRRYYSVAVGSHILGAFLNFSAVSLISPLIQKGAKASTTDSSKDLERRQLSALIRGFSWILLWAPTTLSQAVLLSLFVDINYSRLIILGLLSSVLMIFIGRIFDRIEWPRPRLVMKAQPTPFPAMSFVVVSSVCGLLLLATYLTKYLADFSVAESLMFIAPAITLGWLWAQRNSQQSHHQTPASQERISHVFTAAAPGLVRTAVALGLSGFIGRVAANIVPVADLTGWFGETGMPGWVFLAALPVIITLGGQIALSPIVFVVFLGQVIQALPEMPADPTLIIFSLSVGWALSMTASPNATATLLISATCNIPPTTLTWKWNAKYALVCYLVFTLIFYLLSP